MKTSGFLYFSVYLTLWHWAVWTASIPSSLTETAGMFYSLSAIIAAPFLLISGAMLLLKKSMLPSEKSLTALSILWVLAAVIPLFFNHTAGMIFNGLFAGLWLGTVLHLYTAKKVPDGFKLTAGGIAGIATGFITAQAGLEGWIIQAILPFTAFISSILTGTMFRAEGWPSATLKPLHQSTSKKAFITGVLITVLLLWYVLGFYFWHLLIPRFIEEIFRWLMLPMISVIMSMILIVRRKISVKIILLFVLSLLSSVATGMLYTLQEWIFIAVFSISTATIIRILYQFPAQQLYRVWTGYALCISAILLIVMGINADYYAAHAKAISIPQALVSLSVIQSLVKDLVLAPALLIIIFGVWFMLRRKYKLSWF